MRVFWISLGLVILVCACTEGSDQEHSTMEPDSHSVVDTSTIGSDSTAPGGVDHAHAEAERQNTEDGADSHDDDDGWTHEVRTSSHDGAGIAVIEDVREAAHEGFDRLVIEFRHGILPGYHVSHPTEQIRECGSGEEIDLDSSTSIEIRLEPARGYTEDGQTTVTHEDRSPSLPAIEEIRVICDFEAMFTIAVGTSRRLPFRVQKLENPARLVVDVRHASP